MPFDELCIGSEAHVSNGNRHGHGDRVARGGLGGGFMLHHGKRWLAAMEPVKKVAAAKRFPRSINASLHPMHRRHDETKKTIENVLEERNVKSLVATVLPALAPAPAPVLRSPRVLQDDLARAHLQIRECGWLCTASTASTAANAPADIDSTFVAARDWPAFLLQVGGAVPQQQRGLTTHVLCKIGGQPSGLGVDYRALREGLLDLECDAVLGQRGALSARGRLHLM